MGASLTDTLCTRCGLCCDGSLFADVELAGRVEATRLEVLGLDIEDDRSDGALLLQPCAALKGRRCGVYVHRPACCRTFECRLLQDVRRGAVGVQDAAARIAATLGQIRRVEELLGRPARRGDRLPVSERCAEALARETGHRPTDMRHHATLRAAMSAVERSIRTTFLGDADLAGARAPAPSRPGGSTA